MKTLGGFVCLIALCLAEPVAVHADPVVPNYRFDPIDPPTELGRFAVPYGINKHDVLVGYFQTLDGNLDGFVLRRGSFTDVAVPGVTSGERGILNDVNDLGQAVGSTTDYDTGISYLFVRDKNGEITVLPDVPDAAGAQASGINNAGEIVGFYYDAGFAHHGFIFRDGTYTAYDYPGSSHTYLTKINDRDQITGFRQDADGHLRGFVLQDGVTTTIEVPGSSHTLAWGINNFGHVVGYYDPPNSHGFLFKDGVYTTLDSSFFGTTVGTELLDINDRDVICGTYYFGSYGMVATPVK